MDLFVASLSPEGEPLSAATLVADLSDLTANDGHPTLLLNSTEVIFASQRAGGVGAVGGSDLWVAHRDGPGSAWSRPENLGIPVNSTAGDGTPSLSFDGLTLFLGPGAPRGGFGGNDIWMATRTRIR